MTAEVIRQILGNVGDEVAVLAEVAQALYVFSKGFEGAVAEHNPESANPGLPHSWRIPGCVPAGTGLGGGERTAQRS